MKSLILNNKVIKLYDSIDEMPIINFQKYNKYLLIDSGIGSDIDDIDAHITRIAHFIKTKDSQKALQELQNMRQNMYMINSHISPKYMAFASLIYSIDDKEVTDYSDDNLKAIIESLQKVKHTVLLDLLMWLKKKLSYELELYFPNDFVNPKEKEAYDKLKQRTMLVLDRIVNGNDHYDEIQAIDEENASAFKPKSFLGATSAEIRHDKQFESACVLISQKTNMDARLMTVVQFYNTLDVIKQQIDAENKAYKKHKKK